MIDVEKIKATIASIDKSTLVVDDLKEQLKELTKLNHQHPGAKIVFGGPANAPFVGLDGMFTVEGLEEVLHILKSIPPHYHSRFHVK